MDLDASAGGAFLGREEWWLLICDDEHDAEEIITEGKSLACLIRLFQPICCERLHVARI